MLLLRTETHAPVTPVSNYITAILFLLARGIDTAPVQHKTTGTKTPVLSCLVSAPILICFAYFVFVAMAVIGVQTFLATALGALHGTSPSVGVSSVTGFILGVSTGVLLGGIVADRGYRPERIVMFGLSAAAGLLAIVWVSKLAPLGVISFMSICGFFVGLTLPSRDILARASAPTATAGRVFGFVYSGLDLGSGLAPPLLGWFIDRGLPDGVFATLAIVLLTTAAIAIATAQASRIPRLRIEAAS